MTCPARHADRSLAAAKTGQHRVNCRPARRPKELSVLAPQAEARPLDRRVVITALGMAQILAWGTSFYFPAVFAGPIVADTGWSLGYVVGGTSVGLMVAGLISPQVGRVIDLHGGRPVLLVSSLFYAAGLAGIGMAPDLPVYLLAWVLVGIGMGSGLYDAVFAALGRLYGSEARGPITNLTLFGGFASTVCWPLSAFMIEHAGWRSACFIYAALHLVVAMPLQMAVIGSAPKAAAAVTAAADAAQPVAPARIAHETLIFALLALVLSLAAGIGSIVVVHLLIFLQARGMDFAVAVSLGTLFGPAQVGARVVERLFGNRYHPIWTMIGSCGLMAVGLLLLVGRFPVLAIVILLYGAGYGISWIGRGTLPLALFGPMRFPRLMGKLAFPSLIVQALAPSAGALLIEASGADATIGVLTVLALINVVLIGMLWAVCRPQMSTGA
jgi:MFS family permease